MPLKASTQRAAQGRGASCIIVNEDPRGGSPESLKVLVRSMCLVYVVQLLNFLRVDNSRHTTYYKRLSPRPEDSNKSDQGDFLRHLLELFVYTTSERAEFSSYASSSHFGGVTSRELNALTPTTTYSLASSSSCPTFPFRLISLTAFHLAPRRSDTNATQRAHR